jgi:hypothetical protein
MFFPQPAVAKISVVMVIGTAEVAVAADLKRCFILSLVFITTEYYKYFVSVFNQSFHGVSGNVMPVVVDDDVDDDDGTGCSIL